MCVSVAPAGTRILISSSPFWEPPDSGPPRHARTPRPDTSARADRPASPAPALRRHRSRHRPAPVAEPHGVGIVVPAARVARDAVDDLEADAGMIDADRHELRQVAR